MRRPVNENSSSQLPGATSGVQGIRLAGMAPSLTLHSCDGLHGFIHDLSMPELQCEKRPDGVPVITRRIFRLVPVEEALDEIPPEIAPAEGAGRGQGGAGEVTHAF